MFQVLATAISVYDRAVVARGVANQISSLSKYLKSPREVIINQLLSTGDETTAKYEREMFDELERLCARIEKITPVINHCALQCHLGASYMESALRSVRETCSHIEQLNTFCIERALRRSQVLTKQSKAIALEASLPAMSLAALTNALSAGGGATTSGFSAENQLERRSQSPRQSLGVLAGLTFGAGAGNDIGAGNTNSNLGAGGSSSRSPVNDTSILSPSAMIEEACAITRQLRELSTRLTADLQDLQLVLSLRASMDATPDLGATAQAGVKSNVYPAISPGLLLRASSILSKLHHDQIGDLLSCSGQLVVVRAVGSSDTIEHHLPHATHNSHPTEGFGLLASVIEEYDASKRQHDCLTKTSTLEEGTSSVVHGVTMSSPARQETSSAGSSTTTPGKIRGLVRIIIEVHERAGLRIGYRNGEFTVAVDKAKFDSAAGLGLAASREVLTKPLHLAESHDSRPPSAILLTIESLVEEIRDFVLPQLRECMGPSAAMPDDSNKQHGSNPSAPGLFKSLNGSVSALEHLQSEALVWDSVGNSGSARLFFFPETSRSGLPGVLSGYSNERLHARLSESLYPHRLESVSVQSTIQPNNLGESASMSKSPLTAALLHIITRALAFEAFYRSAHKQLSEQSVRYVLQVASGSGVRVPSSMSYAELSIPSPSSVELGHSRDEASTAPARWAYEHLSDESLILLFGSETVNVKRYDQRTEASMEPKKHLDLRTEDNQLPPHARLANSPLPSTQSFEVGRIDEHSGDKTELDVTKLPTPRNSAISVSLNSPSPSDPSAAVASGEASPSHSGIPPPSSLSSTTSHSTLVSVSGSSSSSLDSPTPSEPTTPVMQSHPCEMQPPKSSIGVQPVSLHPPSTPPTSVIAVAIESPVQHSRATIEIDQQASAQIAVVPLPPTPLPRLSIPPPPTADPVPRAQSLTSGLPAAQLSSQSAAPADQIRRQQGSSPVLLLPRTVAQPAPSFGTNRAQLPTPPSPPLDPHRPGFPSSCVGGSSSAGVNLPPGLATFLNKNDSSTE